MGNSNSTSINDCLLSALGGDASLVAFDGAPLYQQIDVKPYNLDIPAAPVAVTYPNTAEQIANIIKCAISGNLNVAARSGGHSYGNYGLGGVHEAVVVDLKHFQQFTMDNSTWQATIGGGMLLGDVTTRLHDAGGRAMAHGTCPQVGIGGHATIGGLGPTSRMWGSALDHVEEMQVVLANSSIIQASNTSYPDVFWAMKGAGASFGIVTEFKVRTEPEPGQAVLYNYTLQAGTAAEKANAFKKWQTMISDPNLSRKLASQFIMTQFGVVVSGTFFGTKAEFDTLNITTNFPGNSGDAVELNDWLGVVGHWAEDVTLKIGGGVQSHFYAKSLAFTKNDTLSDDAVDKIFDYIDKADKGTLLWFIIWDLEGGAINDIASDATSYGHRDALFYSQVYALDLINKLSSTSQNFVTGFNNITTDSLPGHTLGAYAGYVDPHLQNAQTAYWGSNLPRLKKIKAIVDPKSYFWNPQSVQPDQ